MTTINLVLVCSAGMSTSLLVKKINEYASANNIDANVKAIGSTDVDNHLKNEKPDVLLLGPQVKFMEPQFKVSYPDIPIEVINYQDYGTMNGEKVMKQALSLKRN